MKSTEKLLKDKNIIELSDMLKSLAHPSRIAIMCLLCNKKEKRMTVKCIYEELEMSQPVISRHLGILKNSGLVQRIVEGPKTFYMLREKNRNVEHIAQCFSLFDKG